VLTVSTTNLDVVLVSDGLELVLLLAEFGKLDVHGGAHASSAVGRAACDVAEMLIVCKTCLLLNLGSRNGEALENLTNVRALLHRDDTELVLLVHPDEERLIVVVEDSTGFGPLALQAARLEILVTTLEQEVISNQLLAIIVTHVAKGVVLACKLTIEGFESRDDL